MCHTHNLPFFNRARVAHSRSGLTFILIALYALIIAVILAVTLLPNQSHAQTMYPDKVDSLPFPLSGLSASRRDISPVYKPDDFMYSDYGGLTDNGGSTDSDVLTDSSNLTGKSSLTGSSFYSQNAYLPFYLYSFSISPSSGWLSSFFNQPNSYYLASLFLPPYVHTPLGYPVELAWFLPFLEDYGSGYSNLEQNTSPASDIQEQAENFMAGYLCVFEEAKDLTYQGLVQKFPEDEYVDNLGYTVYQANYYDLVRDKMGLTPAEEAKIDENGFVVSNRGNYNSFGEAYQDFFGKDLPVFISTDSILQALHRSYDDILADLEQNVLMDQLELILSHAQSALPPIAADETGMLADACRDVNIFYTVARKLLAMTRSSLPYQDDEQVKAIIEYVNQLTFKQVDILGEKRNIDFSQFKPRGHYTRSMELQRYFRSMIWLGRIDYRVENPRQLLGACLICKSLEAGGVRSVWDDFDQMIELMVGEPDAMNVRTMTMLMEDAGVQSPQDLLDSQMQSNVLNMMEEKGYGEQRICSHYFESDSFNPEVTPLPKSFAFMGQRFTVDSNVFSKVVYDRVIVDGKKIERFMPNPLDAMFVLGNNRALHHLEGEMTQWPYQGNLSVLRYLADQYDKDFWESNMYNNWLNALRSLSGPFESEGYPRTMLTPAYRDKLLHTQLASWAELRHDTLLYAKQSYTYGVTCEYPDGYVEPVPEFYRRLKNFATRAGNILSSINVSDALKQTYTAHYGTFANTMGMLETLAQKELDSQPRTEEEIQFIKDTIIKKTTSAGCATITRHEGWYPRLFYGDAEKCVARDFITADVHTDVNYQQVLHVGVGKVNVIYFTAETCAGPTLYVGPVFSYYEHIENGMKRLDDYEWGDMVISRKNLLHAPQWTQTFLIDKP